MHFAFRRGPRLSVCAAAATMVRGAAAAGREDRGTPLSADKPGSNSGRTPGALTRTALHPRHDAVRRRSGLWSLILTEPQLAAWTSESPARDAPEKGGEAAAPTSGPEAMKAEPLERGPLLVSAVRRPLERGTP